MNFFGHAIFATWRAGATPDFVLGAMLPDFANMIGARQPLSAEPDIEEGIRFHHATDAVFHDAPTFRGLQATARAALREIGLGRASALAVGHIGVEILLDSAFAADDTGVQGYLSALDAAAGTPAAVDWGDTAATDRYAGLCELLRTRGVTPGAADPSAVAFRVARALSSRPRLRLEDGGERLVHEWAAIARASIADAAPRLVGEVTQGLAERGHRLDVPHAFA